MSLANIILIFVYTKPNLQPPITTVAQALEYKTKLRTIEPGVNYLMSLYVSTSTTTD